MSEMPTPRDPNHRFLDAASGLPPSSRTLRALTAATSAAWADPSRRYAQADVARRFLAQARASIAGALSCRPQEIGFTRDADAALAEALRGVAPIDEGDRRHVVASAIEDVGLLRALDRIAESGGEATIVPCDSNGRVDADEFIATAIEQGATAACLQMANGEVATRQDVAKVGAALSELRIPLITDARHVVGRDRIEPGWQVLAAEARFWGGPAGVGVLAARGGSTFRPMPDNGPLGVEGTAPPVPAITSAALALEERIPGLDREAAGCRALTDRLRHRISESIPDCQVLGSPDHRVGHIAMFSFLYVAADQLVDELARMGWAVASGASCVSDTRRPSHVLVAMGALTSGSLRVSLPPWTDEETIAEFVEDLTHLVGRLRRESGVDDL